MKTVRALGFTLLTLTVCIVAAAAQSLEFEVATIKRYPPGRGSQTQACRGIDTIVPPNFPAFPLGRCLFQMTTLRGLVAIAFRSIDVTGGPGWADSDFYDVEGKAEDPSTTTQAQLFVMMQSLLRDRFKLRVHTVPREVQGYALVVAKGGPKLRPGSGEPSQVTSSFRGGDAIMSATNASMESLANALSRRVAGPVVDQTRLDGRYAFSVPLLVAGDRDSQAAALFTALQEELGLRLEAQKVKAEAIVIETAEKPDLQ